MTPNVALTCTNVHYKDNSHTTDLNNMYNDIVCCLEKAGNNLYSNVKKKKKKKIASQSQTGYLICSL